MNTKEMIEVMQAFEDGKEIEESQRYKDKENGMPYNKWVMVEQPIWNWSNNDYRIKPKEKVKLYKVL